MTKIQFFSVLDVDAMFFHSAVNNFEIAVENKEISDAKNQELESTTWLNDYEAWDLGDEIDVSFTDEQVNYVEGLKSEAKSSSGRFLQAASTVHIFCVSALEAHINKVAEALLSSKNFEHFEKLSIEGKWLFLPQLFGKDGFTPGHQPFQDFSKLIKTRNKLVHHKGKKTPFNIAHDAIGIYKPLGLSLEEISKSMEATKQMIIKLSSLLEQESPIWVQDTSYEYLRIEVVYERTNA